jgi:hypothetical protein
MTHASHHASQQPPSSPQRRQLPAGTRQPVTGERSADRTSQRGTNACAPPSLQPIKLRRQHQKTTAAYDADVMQEEEDEQETDDAMDSSPLWTARSVLRHRPIGLDDPHTGERPTRASSPQPDRRLIRQRTPDTAETSAAVARPSPRRWRWHPLVFVGLGLCIMVMGYLLFGAVSAWWQGTVDGWHYGYPRTSQTDAVVGHHDSPANPSHFIAINLHSHIEVIEFPGGDVTHARVYLGPTLIGNEEDLAPVTLAFRDVNGDGKPDMIISVGGTIVVFLNDGGQFRPLKPGEQVTL